MSALYDCDPATYTGNGLNGRYFDITSVTTVADQPRVTRVDPTINFDWLYESPDLGSIDENNFKADWDGYIDIPAASTYTFFLNSFYNDRARLVIDNQTVVNKFPGAYLGYEYYIEQSGTINFATPGRKKISAYFEETDWIAAMELRWSSSTIPKQIVPAGQLYLAATGSSPGLKARYLGDVATLNDTVGEFNRIDSEINFNWATGSPNTTLLGDNLYGARWKGFVRPPITDSYTFTVSGDDGFMLIIGTDTIINQFRNGVLENKSKTISLTGRTFYPIELIYFENTGNANIKLEWSSSVIPKSVIEQKYLYTTIPTPPPLSLTEDGQDEKNLAPNTGYVLARNGNKCRLLGADSEVLSYEIVSVGGQKIKSGKNEIQTQWIEMDEYQEGLYLIYVVTSASPKVYKFMR